MNWIPPSDWLTLETVEMHTGGEPLRIIVSGLPEIPGNTILEKRAYFKKNLDHIRTGLMWEPRGHADMYGAVITEPVTPDGDTGVFFMHNEGYSTMCGHAVIALTKFVAESGFIRSGYNYSEIKIDAPAGRIIANYQLKNGIVQKSSFLNVPSFVYLKDRQIEIDGYGIVNFDIAFGGAFYAFVEVKDIGLKLNPDFYDNLIHAGRTIKEAIMNKYPVLHPFEPELGFLYGVIFTGNPSNPANYSRHVCIFANGELDRSSTGTGVSARAALDYFRGQMSAGKPVSIESILGTTLEVKVREVVQYGQYQAVIPEVSGSAFYTGKCIYTFDPDDPLKKGFLLR